MPPNRRAIGFMKQKAYAKAGVDIDLGNRVKSGLPRLLASTRRPGVMGKVGGFGGLFALDTRKYRSPVLVSSVDGVGTKLKIAFATGRHDTIGQDLVNHCVNDIAVLGAEALFFLDYLGTGKLEPHVFEEILRGFAQACAENHCALIGGETAQMPGFYKTGEYDLSGTIVGVVDKEKMLSGKGIRPGDVVLGLASNGLHTNGYSLARRVLLDQMKLKLKSRFAELDSTLGEEMLRVHRSYGRLVQKLLRLYNYSEKARGMPAIKGLAHITGGGFMDNIPRVLPRRCDVVIRKGSWEIPPIFSMIQNGGRIDESEMYQVFNMGIGMVLITTPESTSKVMGSVAKSGVAVWTIGEVIRGSGNVRLA